MSLARLFRHSDDSDTSDSDVYADDNNANPPPPPPSDSDDAALGSDYDLAGE